ncbi:MAG: hypothetical protein D6689_19995 [Deltaproteobacteria bacterium]|nr:MAG: hypothetical protein D6689_19995 [Deltaproteobacteria bacterium]
MWIQRLEGEWRVASDVSADPDGDRARVALPVAPSAEPIDLLAFDTLARFGVSDRAEEIVLQPQLADRPVVTRPERPFFIPAGERVSTFVGSPLWLRILESGGGGGAMLTEFPLVRPSDTWFGPNPTDGELCYASRTTCRLRLDEIVRRPHRAITRVTITNRSANPLRLERMKVPVGVLGLYAGDDVALWTQDVDLAVEADGDVVPLTVRPGPPELAGGPAVAPPRRQPEARSVLRAFSSLFG